MHPLFYVPRECYISWWYWLGGVGIDNGGRLCFNLFGLEWHGFQVRGPRQWLYAGRKVKGEMDFRRVEREVNGEFDQVGFADLKKGDRFKLYDQPGGTIYENGSAVHVATSDAFQADGIATPNGNWMIEVVKS